MKNQTAFIRDSLWVPVIMTCATIGLGLILSQMESSIGWKPLLLALVICVTCFSLSFIFYLKFVYPISLELLNDLKRDFGKFARRDSFPNVISAPQLADFEETKDFGEIWLITADMENETPAKLFNSVVGRNLKRGIKYIYFIPKGLRNTARAKEVRGSHGGHQSLSFVYLPDDFFFLTPRLDFAIYDPWNCRGLRCGYMGLPIGTEEQFHGLMETDLLDTLVGRIGEHLMTVEDAK